jgi:hypothetical protein
MLTDFHLDQSSSFSPEQQIINQLLVFQELGILNHPDQLPDPADVAIQLSISKQIVESAYSRWQQEGLNQFLEPIIMQTYQAGYSKAQVETAIAQIWQSLAL